MEQIFLNTELKRHFNLFIGTPARLIKKCDKPMYGIPNNDNNMHHRRVS